MKMKALLTFFLSVWAFLGTIIAPAVLFMLFLCMTGLIYKYDGTMDEGTALYVGLLFFIVFLAFILFPSVAFFKRVKQLEKKTKKILACVFAVAFALGTALLFIL